MTGNRLKGNWTGGVKTKVRNAYITVPVLGAYKINSRLRAKAGIYVSYLMDEEFSGHVYEGYLREGDSTGEKVNFSDGAIATLRTFRMTCASLPGACKLV